MNREARSTNMLLAAVSVTAFACASPASTVVSPTGDLTLVIQQLPAGAQASITLSNEDGYARQLDGAMSITGLGPGDYDIAATPVVVGDTTFTPQPADQRVTIVAGAEDTAIVAFTATESTPYPDLVPGFQARSLVFDGITYKYQIFVPHGYTPRLAWPVILFAHGSDQKGTDNTSQLTVGLGPYVQANAATFPVLVVFPQQAPTESSFAFDSMMIAMLDATTREANVDPAREYLTGVSTGAFRAWAVAYQQPARFAAFAPMSGGLTPSEFGVATEAEAIPLAQAALHNLPIHQYNGTADTVVPIATYGYPLRDAFESAHAPYYTFIAIAGASHQGTWDTAYHDPAFWTWLWAQRRPGAP